jgi:hypothetical protein
MTGLALASTPRRACTTVELLRYVRSRTAGKPRGGIRFGEMPDDLTLSMRVNPGDTYEWSRVLLARAHFDGTLELLTAAWERALGYGRHELAGKTLCQLLAPGEPAAAAVAAIPDERNIDAVDLSMRCRDGREKRLRLHRRLDAYERTVFIVAEDPRADAAT